jgi:hydroxymethylpyrimidine pyrophosphatase-like HAD family hydrolase
VRCLYVDLDATLLGPGGAVTRDGDGRFTLLGLRALEACERAGMLVVAMSGRPRAMLAGDLRLLGIGDYIFEAGAGYVLDGELHWLGDPDGNARIAASGAVTALVEHFDGRLEADPQPREASHLLRGLVDVAEAEQLLAERGHRELRLIDNGPSYRHSRALAETLPSVHAYHLIARTISKSAAVAAHARARGLHRDDCLAVGDSREDLEVAESVGALWLVANALEHEPNLRQALARHPNARVAEAAHGPGVYEAVITTLAESR